MTDLDTVAKVVAEAPSLALACHVDPDGDALGSMLALHHLAIAAGVPSVASWPAPFLVAPHYAFLPGLELAIDPAHFPSDPPVMVTFDCGSLDRLGELAIPATRAGELVVIDHHATNAGYGTVNLIDPAAAASAVVVRRLADRLGWPLTREAAACLYTGLVCDTGRFQYDNTTPEVFELARELSSYDLPISNMSRQLFEQHHFAYLRLAGVALERALLDRDRRFVAAWVTADDFARFDVTVEETEGLIDLVRRTVEADVSCVLKETPDGTRVSLRSVSDFDVGAIASGFGGGGHRAAAGFLSDRSWPEVLDDVRQALGSVAARHPSPEMAPTPA